jgi:hypothetical protein
MQTLTSRSAVVGSGHKWCFRKRGWFKELESQQIILANVEAHCNKNMLRGKTSASSRQCSQTFGGIKQLVL